MEHLFVIASVWLGLAVISAIIAYHLRISIALVEICVGVGAGALGACRRIRLMPGLKTNMMGYVPSV